MLALEVMVGILLNVSIVNK